MSEPDRLPALPTQPFDVSWPTQRWPEAALPEATDGETLCRLLDLAFTTSDQLGKTHAFLAVQGGQVVAERYGEGYGPEETYPSWSKAKSITHALAGLAIADGAVDLHAPADVPEWRVGGDPRAQITLEQLLRMSSGLQFVEDYVDAGISHTIDMLFGAGKADVAHFAADKLLEHPPGTHWLYSSGTTNIIARLLAEALGTDRDGFEAYMRERLFEPIGMSSAIPKFDEAGTFIGSSFCYCTARDFARFGLLYLRDGVWEGARILPEGWVDHARTPTLTVPPEEPMGYGAHWWLGLAGPGSFSANGYDGQYTVLVPQKDLILVRHGASEAQKDAVREWLADVAGCFGEVGD
ncbi:MAG: serine hydrolase [Pseudomonadota bacterium]